MKKRNQVVLETEDEFTKKTSKLTLTQQTEDKFTVNINNNGDVFHFEPKDLTDIIQAFSYLVGRAAVYGGHKR